MRTRILVSAAALGVALVLAPASHAQATRTWVSGVGDDVNPCSRTAPCKTFAGAISKTSAGGEIDALDPGGFGTVTITKALTIDGHGTFASILASGANGITVNAGVNDVVVLRGIAINGTSLGAAPGVTGIRFLAGKALVVDGCTIFEFGTHGIEINHTGTGSVLIRNSTIRRCGDTGNESGLSVTAMTQANVVVEESCFEGSYNGITAINNGRVTVRNSFISGGAAAGVQTTTATSEINLDHSVISGNATGISSGGTVRISDSAVTANGTGLAGTVYSFGNNRLVGNTVLGTAPTPIAQQ